MASNYVEFQAPTGLTLTASLFAEASDTVAYTANSVLEQTNRKGIYKAGFTSQPTGEYQIIAFDGTNPVAVWWVSITSSSGTYTAGERLYTTNVADAVWDEAYSGHTTAGTFGKLMDTLRKANLLIEGTVAVSPSPTTTTFGSNVTSYPNSAFAHAVLVFTSGAAAEQNSPITSYTASGGVFVLEEALTNAPSSGDTFVIYAGQHVHSMAEIAAAVSSSGGLSSAQAAQLAGVYSRVHGIPVVLSSTATNVFGGNPLTIYRGSEHSSYTPLGPVTFNVSNSYSVSGWTGTLKIFEKYGSATDAVISVAGSWADTGLTTQRIEFTLQETDTDNLNTSLEYSYQVELVCGTGHPYASPEGSVIFGSIHS